MNKIELERLTELAGASGLLTVREIADALSVKPRTVRRWVQKGLLPGFVTLGGHIRIRLVDVEKALYNQVVGEYRDDDAS